MCFHPQPLSHLCLLKSQFQEGRHSATIRFKSYSCSSKKSILQWSKVGLDDHHQCLFGEHEIMGDAKYAKPEYKEIAKEHMLTTATQTKGRKTTYFR